MTFFLPKSELKSAVVIIHKRWFSVKKYHQSPSAISATPTTAGRGFFSEIQNPIKNNKKNPKNPSSIISLNNLINTTSTIIAITYQMFETAVLSSFIYYSHPLSTIILLSVLSPIRCLRLQSGSRWSRL